MLFVFLSFLFGLANFLDTTLKLMFSYMSSLSYPSWTYLKSVFFILQAICLAFFVLHITKENRSVENKNVQFAQRLHLLVLTTVVFVFFFDLLMDQIKYGGFVYYTSGIWLFSYLVGLAVTCFWFSAKLLNTDRYLRFAPVFLLLGLAFTSNVVASVFFWPQTFFHVALPSEVDVGSRLLTTTLVLAALFYASAQLIPKGSVRKNLASSLRDVRLYLVFAIFLLPLLMDAYKEGLFSLVVRALVYWGLGYTGRDWYFTGLYLAAFVTYLFLVLSLRRRLPSSVSSTLIFLGVVSFPWNGIMVFEFGYSSILGNMLSLNALITGFLIASQKTSAA